MKNEDSNLKTRKGLKYNLVQGLGFKYKNLGLEGKRAC